MAAGIKLTRLSSSARRKFRPWQTARRLVLFMAASAGFLLAAQYALNYWPGATFMVAASAIVGAALWAANLGYGAESWRELQQSPTIIEGMPLKVLLDPRARRSR